MAFYLAPLMRPIVSSATAVTRLILLLTPTALTIPASSDAFGQSERAEFRPGLVARFQGEGERNVVRIDPSISFNWGEGPPDARMENGKFSVAWRSSAPPLQPRRPVGAGESRLQ